MKYLVAPIVALGTISPAGFAQAISDHGLSIWNQDVLDQCPGRFRICHDLEHQEAQASMVFTQLDDSTDVFGLHARGEEMTNKGSLTSVLGSNAMDSLSGQAGSSSGSLAYVRGFFSNGQVHGVAGSATGESLSNFSSSSTSEALGGSFSGGADASISTLTLDGVGDYYTGGVRGSLRGRIDGNPGGGAVAGVIGVDAADPASTAPHYAGYFLGDVCVSEEMIGRGGRFLLDSASNPGRTFELTSTGRQEIRTTNDFVIYGGSNIGLRPTGGFRVSDTSGANTLIYASPAGDYVSIGGTAASGSHRLTVYGSACATGGFTTCSSRRFKENVDDLEQATEIVDRLRGVRYTSKFTGEREIGLIAEEVAEVLPEIVSFEEDGQSLGVDYSRLTAILVEGMKEQQAVLSELSQEVEELRSQLQSQE